MKKNLLYLAICTALCVLISCQSTGKKKEEPFTVRHDSPQYQIGEVVVQLDPAIRLGKIKKQSVNVLYVLEEDAVVLRFRQDFMTFQSCWSRDGRQAFIDALKRYNEDYDARLLETNENKTVKKYGTVKGYLIWQMFKYTTRAMGTLNVHLGYAFKDKAPYFVARHMSAEYIDPISRTNNSVSTPMNFYFTRAQAAELAALFDPEFIDGLSIVGGSSRFKLYVEQDDYREAE